MIAIAFIAFALMIFAWLFGPSTESKPTTELSGAGIKVGEAAA
jgi:hypothetical protein